MLAALAAFSGLSIAEQTKPIGEEQIAEETSIEQVAQHTPATTKQLPLDDYSQPAQLQYEIQLEPPSAARVFQVESEENLRERIRQEARQRGEPFEFPQEDPELLAEQPFVHQPGPHQVSFVVPHVVCYKPLYFEEKVAERYGWDAGVFQPFLSTAKFYTHLAILPYNMGVLSPCQCDCNTGYWLPGDCTPYQIYYPPPSLKGAALQAGTVAGGIAIFP